MALHDGAPRILRPGGLPAEAIAQTLGRPLAQGGDAPVVPGSLPSHYAPRASVVPLAPETLPRALIPYRGQPSAGLLSAKPVDGFAHLPFAETPAEAAQQLYSRLREADALGWDPILVVLPPAQGLGVAVTDRILRASAPRPSTGEP